MLGRGPECLAASTSSLPRRRVGITGLWLVAYGTGVFRELDLDTVDWRFSIRGENEPPAKLAVVGIDDVTFDELNEFPLARRRQAQVIRRLKADGARVIAYDIQFSEETTPEDDNALFLAVQQAGNVVLATTEVGENGEPNALGGPESLKAARAVAGNGNFDSDPGGIIRRLSYEIDGLKSFAVVTAERSGRRSVQSFDADETWIDYAGPAGTIPTYSLSRIHDGDFKPGTFRDRIVVVGATAPSEQDLHPTSFGEHEMPGPEIQANAISTVLSDLPLKSAPGWLNLLLVIGLGMLAPLASLRLNLRGTLTDLRGFTSVSEALPAAEVIQIVNYYLGEMTHAIQDHGGTLVSYEGDGIMAVFGAPLEQPDHADRAIAASREMLAVRLPRFNEWLREREIGDGS